MTCDDNQRQSNEQQPNAKANKGHSTIVQDSSEVFKGHEMINDDHRPLFILEMANNHMGSVKHGIQIIRECAEVTRNFPFRFAVKLHTAISIHLFTLTTRTGWISSSSNVSPRHG